MPKQLQNHLQLFNFFHINQEKAPSHKKKINFLYIVIKPFGGVAHLARALAWHARGKGFKSPHLHHKPTSEKKSVPFFKQLLVNKKLHLR